MPQTHTFMHMSRRALNHLNTTSKPPPHMLPTIKLPTQPSRTPLVCLSHIHSNHHPFPRRTRAPPSRASTSPTHFTPSQSPPTARRAISHHQDSPTLLERLSAAAMFVLPLSEGMYRLFIAIACFCRQNFLDIWMWCQLQRDNLRLVSGNAAAARQSAEELQACEMVMQWSQQLYLHVQGICTYLSSLSQASLLVIPCSCPLLPFLPPQVSITPIMVWDLSCALALVSMVGLVWNQRGRGEGGLSRRPELVQLCFLAAVLLRISWVPLNSLSGVMPNLYHISAVVLTASTTFLSLAAIIKVLFDRLDQFKANMKELVEGTKGVVLWHQNLVYLDWMLSMTSLNSLAAAGVLLVRFFCYAFAVDLLGREVDLHLAEVT